MTMKHTPGPWTVDAMGFIYASADSELPENSNQGAELVLAKLLSHSTVRTAGNANLIAAAPDLLAQHNTNLVDLDLLRRAIAEGDPKAELLVRVDDLIRFSRDAIAKAVSSHV